MKSKLSVLLCMLSVGLNSCFALNGKISIEITVKDEEGKAIENAEALLRIPYYENSKTPREVIILTDNAGQARFEDRVDTPIVIDLFINKEGYYQSVDEVEYVFHDHGKLAKANLIAVEFKKQITLKRIKNPIAMYAKRLGYDYLEMPLNENIGFDLRRVDFVQPYGDGKEDDFAIRVSQKGNASEDEYEENILEIIFPQKEDGLQKFVFDERYGSKLKSDYFAPKNEYLKSLRYVTTKEKTENGYEHWTYPFEREDVGYYFRTRTIVDENGELIEAHYSKMYNDFMFWIEEGKASLMFKSTYFNPNNLDRNLEFDPSKNLANPDKKHRVDLP